MSYTFKAQKDPAELLDFTIDFTPDLNASEPLDVINGNEWRIEGRDQNLTIVTTDTTSTTCTVWLSGGSKSSDRYRAICRATTVGGRTFEASILIEMAER